MARPRSQDRFDHLVRTAVQSFISARGYQAMQMGDLAAAAGVSKGALYGYFESKAAVLDQAIRHADDDGVIPEPDSLPVREAGIEETVRHIELRIAEHALPKKLRGYLERAAPAGTPEQELREVTLLLFNTLWDGRNGIKLIDVCAKDHPGLARAWFGPGRETILKILEALIEKRVASGHYAQPEDTAHCARFLLESCVFWAVHVHWDPHPQSFERERLLRSLPQLLTTGLLGTNEQRGSKG